MTDQDIAEPEEKMVNLGLKGDQVFQRYFLKRVQYGREFKIMYRSGRSRVGYITGFDEFNLQISTSSKTDPKAVLIPLSSIEEIEETGAALNDLPEGIQEKIRDYSKALRSQCAREINTQKRAKEQRS